MTQKEQINAWLLELWYAKMRRSDFPKTGRRIRGYLRKLGHSDGLRGYLPPKQIRNRLDTVGAAVEVQ